MEYNPHKVGNFHHYGLILNDGYMWDKSGRTVTLYYKDAEYAYSVIEWDEGGQNETWSETYDNYEEAAKSYVNRTFGVMS